MAEGLRIPVAAYRLQFNKNFRFPDAKRIIPYLHALGITDIYASPYFKAKEGSLHGYDIVDHGVLNPEIGSEKEYDELCEELGKYGMGQILDIVPNHMCITDNLWWADVLENGQSSKYAGFFDIDWEPVKAELKGKVLLPVLGDQYGRALENQELRLSFEEGAFFVYYQEQRFPIRPHSYAAVLGNRLAELKEALPSDEPNLAELLSIVTAIGHLPLETETSAEKVDERYREKEVLKKRLWKLYGESPVIRSFVDENVRAFNGEKGSPGSFDLLDGLLREQVYRLSFWRVATDEINYRRFFDINELAAIKMEDPRVFEAAHGLVFKLIGEGKVAGLRVDHIDGLYDPPGYLKELQANCCRRTKTGGAPPDDWNEKNEALLDNCRKAVAAGESPFYIIGEKVLVKGERITEGWPVYGTVGYDFLNALNTLFVDAAGAKVFDKAYGKFNGASVGFPEIAYEKKKLVMQVEMQSEINTLGHYLDRIAERHRHTRDFTLNSLINAIVEVIAYFPVYRTYVRHEGVSDADRQHIELAASKARRKNPAISGSIFDFLRDVLLLRFPADFEEGYKQEQLDFVLRFQQLTGPVMAKGLEDTAFYAYNRLISLNEIGGTPDRFGASIEAFHGQNIERLKAWPHSFNCTSSHDTKRSEDVRARINALSEIPKIWSDSAIRWRRINKTKKAVVDGSPAPEPNEEWFLYQTLIGGWPYGQPPAGLLNEAEYDAFRRRIKDYMLKALREAKVNTSWINPDKAYEDAVMGFIDSLMGDEEEFLKDFLTVQREISRYGMYNSLSQTLLKIASPGAPEFYQGTETWNLRLVDPDNRGPVDYVAASAMLDELKSREAAVGTEELVKELTSEMENGKLKLYMTYKALNFRRENREIFEKGDYAPLEASGEKSENVCAFARTLGGQAVIAVAPRFFTRLLSAPDGLPCGPDVWKNTFIQAPLETAGARYLNVFSGKEAALKEMNGAAVLYLSEALSCAPAALLTRLPKT